MIVYTSVFARGGRLFWFLSIREFSLVIMCSVPPHLIMFLRSLNLDLGFKMKASSTMPSETTLEVTATGRLKLLFRLS